MSLKRLGKKIKLARVARDLTQEQLGALCRMSQKRISRYENALTPPSLSSLELLAKSLKIPLDHFLNDNFED